MSAPTHDVVATLGEYTDRQTGEKKKRYHTCGTCFTDDQGRQSIKIDAIPGPGWSGWLSLYPRDRQEAPTRQQAADPRSAPVNRNIPAQRATPPPATDDDEDIPF